MKIADTSFKILLTHLHSRNSQVIANYNRLKLSNELKRVSLATYIVLSIFSWFISKILDVIFIFIYFKKIFFWKWEIPSQTLSSEERLLCFTLTFLTHNKLSESVMVSPSGGHQGRSPPTKELLAYPQPKQQLVPFT